MLVVCCPTLSGLAPIKRPDNDPRSYCSFFSLHVILLPLGVRPDALPSSDCAVWNMANMNFMHHSQVEVSSPQQDTLERVRQLNTERQALAQQRAQAEHAKQVRPVEGIGRSKHHA